MKKSIKIKLTALLLTFAIVFTTIPIVAMAKQTSVDGEKPAYIVGEIESMRTETEKVFRMSDGKMQMAVYNDPVHFENEDGEWEEINNKLKSQDSDTYTTKNTVQDISLSKKYKKGKTVEIATEDTNISWGFVGANNSEAEIVEQKSEELEGDEKFTTIPNAVSTTVYKDIYDNIDAEYIITGGQVKENLILNKETDQNEFEIEYRYKKLTPVQKDDKTIELQNSKGKTIYTITAPIMTDDKGAFSDDLKLEIVSDKNNKLTVKLIVDKEWLQDKDRDYPVTIDPQLNLSDLESTNTFVSTSSASINDTNNVCAYNSAVQVNIYNLPILAPGSYITNVVFRLGFTNLYSAELPIYFIGDANASSIDVSSGIINNYAEDVCDTSNDTTGGVWNITKSIQQFYTTSNLTTGLSSVYAIAGTPNDLYTDLGYNASSQECNLYPSLQITYINQSGINEKYSYHEFDMEEAGILYYNDLTVSPIVKRDDFSVENSVGTVDIGMTYTTDFNQNIGASAYYYWKPYYSDSVSYYPNNSNYKYVWNTDDGEVIYFNSDDNGNYVDERGEGYILTSTSDTYTITTSDSKVFEFTQDGRNYSTQNEKYLTKIYEEGLSDSALNIEYNTALRISKLTDPDGNEYVYTYDENDSNILLSVECEEQDKLVEYSYTNGNLTEVTCGDNTVNYEYHSSSNEDYNLKAIVLPEDYKLTLINETTGFGQEITEYGYDSDSDEWVQGSRLSVSRYPAKTIYYQLDEQNEATYSEIYRFDKNGYLASVFNGDGYAINQNADQEGNVFANTEITIPVVNLANDSSFEKSTSGWTSTNASVQTKSETVNNAYFGNKWLEINNTSFTTAKANQTVTGLSKGTYTFSAYVKTAENNKIELDENNTIYDGVSIRATVGETTKKATGISGEYDDWTRVYVTFDVAENNSSANIELGLYNAKGNIYVDAVQLEKHKRAYDYNAVENADFSNNTVWDIDGTVSFVENTSKRGSLDNKALKITNGSAEQEIYLSNVSDASISAWVSTVGMTATDENCKISVIGYNDNTPTILAEKDIDFCLSASADNEISFYKVMMPIDTKTNYDNYKIKIEYKCPYGYMLVDGVEVMSGVMNITETEDEDATTDTETGLETAEQDDYQIEDGYTIVSTINSFDTYTGNENCDYLVNGTVVNSTNEDGETVKDETASTAYLGNSWGVTQSKDKYEYTDSTGATKTTGGIWIGNKLDKTTQSGIRFWYKSTALCSVQLRSATYGKGGTYDYIKTLPAAPKGTWVTLLYKDIETTKRKITDFKYLFVKTSTQPVYVDEVQTVLQDTIIYDDVEYNISEISQEENNNYPVIDEYIYDSTINNFNSYTGEFGYLVNGSTSNSTAYSGNSWGVTKNVDKYEYVDEDTNETYLSYGIVVGSFDNSKDGIRFWYKSSKECQVILREQFYGILETDYKVTLPAAPNGDWYTILFDDVANANRNLSDYYCIFVKTGSSPSVYIDELYYVVLDDEYYSVTESYETSRDGQVMKTESASKSLTLNNKLCTINKETNSLGVNTFTTTEDETGNQISATDGNGNTINYSYDDLNNLIEMSQEVDETNLEVNYTYDNKGNISTITNGNVTYTYKYTPFGDLKSISVGNTPLLTYTYESNQNRVVTKITYANGQSVEQIYDDMGLVTLVDEKDANGTTTNLISYIYSETGELLKTIDGNDSYSVTLTYLDEVQVWNSDETELLYSTFQSEDKAVDYIDNNRYTTFYTSTSEETHEKNNVSESVSTTTYGDITVSVYTDAFGRTIKEQTKSGDNVVLLKEYEYTSNGKYATEQIKSVTTTVGSSTPETIRYTYDNNGNITGIYSKVGNNAETTVATYEYDELNQLVKENDKNYVYDNYGNIISAGDNSYSYSIGEWKDQLTSFNGESISYDDGGNPLNYMGATLTWEKGRQLKSYSDNNVYVNYQYNTDGLRTKKEVNGTVYNYVWSGSKLVHQSGGNKNIHFYYDATDSIVGFEYGGDKYTYIKNIQGDIVGILGESGNTLATYTYDAWGNILTATGTLAEINPIRYRGYYYDGEINMYYLQSRYYDQNVGRFINADTPSNLSSQNNQEKTILSYSLQAYCENNSIYYVDFTGNAKIKVERKVAVITIKEFSSESNYNLKALKKIYKTNNGVKKVVKSVKTFKNAWNSLDQLDCLVINTHGLSDGLYLGDGTPLVTTKNVNKLGYKKHTCVISLACDTGNYYNMWTNIAYRLECSISGVMVASDGIVSCWKDDDIKDFLYAPLNSDNRKQFFGWVIYRHGGYNKYGKKGYDYWNSTNLPKGDWNGVTLAQIISYLISYNVIPKI